MKKIFLLWGLVGLIASLSAQSVLWQVSGRNLQAPSYLYGTIHIQDGRVFSFDSTVWHCFDQCDALAVELLLDELNVSAVREEMMLPKGQTLNELFPKEDYRALDSLCKAKLGAGLIFFNRMKPFFLLSALQQVDIPKEMPVALDMFLLQQARAKGMQCHGLEDYMEQIKAIDAISLKEQVKMLQDVIYDTNSMAVQFDSLLDAYLSADMDKWEEMLKDPSLPENFNKRLLEKRNVTMYKGFCKLTKKHRVFCAVGCGHLAGDQGLIEMLRKKGYTVEPVMFSWTK